MLHNTCTCCYGDGVKALFFDFLRSKPWVARYGRKLAFSSIVLHISCFLKCHDFPFNDGMAIVYVYEYIRKGKNTFLKLVFLSFIFQEFKLSLSIAFFFLLFEYHGKKLVVLSSYLLRLKGCLFAS